MSSLVEKDLRITLKVLIFVRTKSNTEIMCSIIKVREK